MNTEGLQHNRRTPSAPVWSGEVLKKYHPHGDAAVYDALVRLAQDWNMRYPAHRRAGKLRLHRRRIRRRPIATPRRGSPGSPSFLLADIDKETVDFGAELRRHAPEPRVLPDALPQSARQRLAGIAVGMATNIPPHNLGEVIDAVISPHRQPRSRPVGGADAAHPRAGLPHRRLHPGPRGQSAPSTRPAAAPSRCARGPRSRPQEDRARDHRRHRDPVPGQQGRLVEQIAELVQGEAARGHQRPARRVVPRGHAHRHRDSSATRCRRWC